MDGAFKRLLREAGADPDLRDRIIEDPNWAADHFQLSPIEAYRLERFLDFRERSTADFSQLRDQLKAGGTALRKMDENELLEWGKCLKHDTRKVAKTRGAPFVDLLKTYRGLLKGSSDKLSSRNKLRSRILIGHIDYLLGNGEPVYFDVLPTYRKLEKE